MRGLVATCLSGAALTIGLATPASADPTGGCPPGGGWQLTPSAGTQFDVADRNGDDFACVRFFNNEHVPHSTVFADNHRPL